jgi:hypothetical protein
MIQGIRESQVIIIVKTTLSLALLVLILANTGHAQDIPQLEEIGPVVSFTKSERALVISCTDKSQVQVTSLAVDLLRIRASFAKPLPARDHSWAIAKTDWATVARKVLKAKS